MLGTGEEEAQDTYGDVQCNQGVGAALGGGVGRAEFRREGWGRTVEGLQ